MRLLEAEPVAAGDGFGSRKTAGEGPRHDDNVYEFEFTFARTRGRRRLLSCDDLTLMRIWDAGRDQCTFAETAACLGVCERTLRTFFDNNPIAEATFEDARLCGRGSMRSVIFSGARDGNVALQMLVGKTYLGMGERIQQADPRAAITEMMHALGASVRSRHMAFVDKEEEKPVPVDTE